MGILTVQRKIEASLQEWCVNSFWLREVLHGDEGKIGSAFPYQVQNNGTPRIGQAGNFTFNDIIDHEPEGEAGKPLFLVNVPMGVSPLSDASIKVEALLQKFESESFSTSTEASQNEVGKKLAVVIGVNQIESIDKRVNACFQESIESTFYLCNVPHQVEGFFWVPSWEENASWKKFPGVALSLKKIPRYEKKVYAKEKAFFLVQCLNGEKAGLLRSSLEGKTRINDRICSQIPYQMIRQRIKASAATTAFAQAMAKKASKDTPVYFVTMDDDVRQLRTEGKGYFSLLEKKIKKVRREKQFFPSIISLGYQLGAGALPITRLAVRCDMLVREAMNQVIPGSVYMPEPGTAYLLSENADLISNLAKFSFCSSKSNDHALESRRAMINGIERGILQKERTFFFAEEALITTMPSRMATETCKKIGTLHPIDLKKKNVLQALRGVSQVHFSPLDWGHNLYEALPPDIKKGAGISQKLSGILSKVFTVFDPITFAYAIKFDPTCAIYESAVAVLLSGKIAYSRGQPVLVLAEELKQHGSFLQAQFSLLLTAKTQLLGLRMSDEWVDKVVKAGYVSGKALFEELSAFRNGG